MLYVAEYIAVYIPDTSMSNINGNQAKTFNNNHNGNSNVYDDVATNAKDNYKSGKSQRNK